MLLAVLVTLVKMYTEGIIGFELIAAGLVLGTIIGYIMATTVEMTEMPELVALFNGFGGGHLHSWAFQKYSSDYRRGIFQMQA